MVGTVVLLWSHLVGGWLVVHCGVVVMHGYVVVDWLVVWVSLVVGWYLMHHLVGGVCVGDHGLVVLIYDAVGADLLMVWYMLHHRMRVDLVGRHDHGGGFVGCHDHWGMLRYGWMVVGQIVQVDVTEDRVGVGVAESIGQSGVLGSRRAWLMVADPVATHDKAELIKNVDSVSLTFG